MIQKTDFFFFKKEIHVKAIHCPNCLSHWWWVGVLSLEGILQRTSLKTLKMPV
jgi:hypothetical protein